MTVLAWLLLALMVIVPAFILLEIRRVPKARARCRCACGQFKLPRAEACFGCTNPID